MLTFNKERHEYRWQGDIVPSVTQILAEWREVRVYGSAYHVNVFDGTVIAKDIFSAAADFGSAVHQGAALILQGGLDWEALDPALVPVLRQFERFVLERKLQPVMVEGQLFSKLYWYAGTTDIIGKIDRDNSLLVIDIKTGGYSMAGPQTAGYEQAYREETRYRGRMKRAALLLPKDGSDYKLVPLTRRDDFAFFKVRKYQYEWMR